MPHLERAVELTPTDPIINDHLGDALWMVGRKREARFQWSRAMSFDPEEKDAERIRAKLDRGLDAVLADERADGPPRTAGAEAPKADGG
ncbi:MAG: tetratricopeptide repeat protein [Albimonas sp.]|uniref:tetratricopeptide repeat protein n=1 Tax=Albimonas sp. TaxID=1872425 RepID=UPI00405732B7